MPASTGQLPKLTVALSGMRPLLRIYLSLCRWNVEEINLQKVHLSKCLVHQWRGCCNPRTIRRFENTLYSDLSKWLGTELRNYSYA
jgi:hypothetical protein